jgi:predicted transcriptional regulator
MNFYKRDVEIFECCDDSFGNVGEVFRFTAVEAYLGFARQCADKQEIADEILNLQEVIMVHPEMEMAEIKDYIDIYNLDYLPVVDEERVLLGFIEKRSFDRYISTKMIELQKQAESLG